MKIEIEISDDELREYILTAAGKSLFAEWSVDRNLYKRTIADCVRQVIYEDKDEIINRIVAQASRECGNKAVQKILKEALKDAGTDH
mgnify:CR=1 FL=1